MDAERVFQRQRELRATLLDRPRISWSPARDLAAHLLLHLDDDAFCWRLSTQWLRDALDADRVDAGFGSPRDTVFRPQAEALRASREMASVANLDIDGTDPGVQGVWRAMRVSVFADIAQERSFRPALREGLLNAGAHCKLAASLWYGGAPIGLACADWSERRIDAGDVRCSRFQEVVTSVLAPIMSAARSLREEDQGNGGDDDLQVLPGARLTPAERKVAELAATGLSYKEIARQLGRSFSTVDHQLRSVRAKLGVRSHGRLVRLLADRGRGGFV